MKSIKLSKYKYRLMNFELVMDNFTVYVEDHLDEQCFDPDKHSYRIPRYEQARAMVILAAKKSELLKFSLQDKEDGIVAIYKRACKRELSLGRDELIKPQVEAILSSLP